MKITYFVIFSLSIIFYSCSNSADKHISIENQPISNQAQTSVAVKSPNSGVRQINDDEFKNLVFDYSNNSEWVFNKELPCVVDFYTDWCRPCKMVAPIMDELAEMYKGRVNFYKVNTEQAQIVAYVFGIRSIPTILFCPINNKEPQMRTGAMQKEDYIKLIDQILLTK